MSEIMHTPGPWPIRRDGRFIVSIGPIASESYAGDAWLKVAEADAILAAAAPELLEALTKAIDFIDGIRQDLHNRRIADWFPEGANNAANAMSEDMRMIGNACADFDIGDVIAKATGDQS